MRVTGVNRLFSGKFLNFNEIEYENNDGKCLHWESIERVNNPDIVSIVPYLSKSQMYIIISIYRPTVNARVLSFPAGLVDKGETAEDAAKRELKEETGFIGEVVRVTEPTLSSEGLSNETVMIVEMNIDEDLPENKNPQQQLEGDEDIDVWLVEEKDMKSFIQSQLDEGVLLSGRFTSYFLGRGLI